MTLDSLIDTVDIQLVRINDSNNWTSFYADIELVLSRYTGNSGQSFEIKYRQLDDGGTNLFQFSIDTLFNTNTNNAIVRIQSTISLNFFFISNLSY